MKSQFPMPAGRRDLVKGGVATALALLAAPSVLRAQGAPGVKIGVIQPVTGALAGDGDLGRLGAQLAIDDINAAGGIRSLGGAKLEMVFGDSRSNPQDAAQQVEQLNGAGVSVIVGGFASGLCATATQVAARYGLPYMIDSAVADELTQHGQQTTFRFGPSFSMATTVALANLVRLNTDAGKPAHTVVIVHEDGLFGTGMARVLNAELPKLGFQVLETIAHPTPARDMSNVVLRIRALQPDLVIPSHYYGEFVLMARTLQQQRVHPKGIYAIFGGGASSLRFVKEFPEAAEGVMDCNHWHDPKNPRALQLRRQTEAAGKSYAYNVPINYAAVTLVAEALDKAASADRARLMGVLGTGSFGSSVMPYGQSRFTDGQNVSALPLNTQVQNGDVKVIYPLEYAEVKPIFPVPAKG